MAAGYPALRRAKGNERTGGIAPIADKSNSTRQIRVRNRITL